MLSNQQELLELRTRNIIEAEMMKPEVWECKCDVLSHKTLPMFLVKYSDGTVRLSGTDIEFTKAQYNAVARSIREYKKIDAMNSIIEMHEKQKEKIEFRKRVQDGE